MEKVEITARGHQLVKVTNQVQVISVRPGVGTCPEAGRCSVHIWGPMTLACGDCPVQWRVTYSCVRAQAFGQGLKFPEGLVLQLRSCFPPRGTGGHGARLPCQNPSGQAPQSSLSVQASSSVISSPRVLTSFSRHCPLAARRLASLPASPAGCLCPSAWTILPLTPCGVPSKGSAQGCELTTPPLAGEVPLLNPTRCREDTTLLQHSARNAHSPR